jgi:GT2 family glycosyltransferase
VPDPLVSVLVLSWNSRELVGEAVESALAQTAGPVEVLVCDNASSDGTAFEVARLFHGRARVVCFERNLGYTGGYNRALALAKGQFLLLLTPDARLAPDFLARALPAFDDPRVGIVASRLMRPDGVTVDSSGQFLSRSRKPLDRGYGRPFDPRRDAAGPVLAACGAAALYRRTMVRDIALGAEFFDHDYFAFHEDLEVGWRAFRAGWKAVAVPDAVAVHLRAGGTAPGRLGLAFERSDEILACVVRNRWLAMLRHDRVGPLLLDAPFVLARDAAFLLMALFRRPGVLRRIWAARGTFAHARWHRRNDRDRRGAWGTWSRRVPPRGAFRR